MKKLSYLLLSGLILVNFFTSCDKDEAKDTPTGFLASHVGNWKTTYLDLELEQVINISSSNFKIYSKYTFEDCYNLYTSSTGGGTTVFLENTPEKLSYTTTNIPASSLFSGEDLLYLLDNGIYTLSSSTVFLQTTPTIISFAEIIYAGDIEILTLSGNFSKINSFVQCSAAKISNQKSENKYKLSKGAKMLLNKN